MAQAIYADGYDATQGQTTDPGVQGDSPGTVSAKLRGINATLAQLATDEDTPEEHPEIRLLLLILAELRRQTLLLARVQGISATAFEDIPEIDGMSVAVG